jgi:DNA-binding XRE family transcriptional regulator
MSDLMADVRDSLALPGPEVRRRIRVAAGIARARLATELGVHLQTVVRWEAGTREPRGELRVAYARLLRDLDRTVRDHQEQP